MGILLVGHLAAQAPVRLAEETAFRKEPRGLKLLTIMPGVRVTPGRASNDHVEVTLQGWIFTGSTQADKREGFDLSVSAPAGENLRAAPDGPVIARAVSGALFSRLAGKGGWTEVRRKGWIARAAVAPPERVAARPAPAPAAPRPRDSTPPVAAAVPVAVVAVDTPATARRGALSAGTVLQKSPEGERVATLAQSADVTLGERDRDWIKVTVSGWVRATDVRGDAAPIPAITAAMLRQSPDKYIGQTVDWRIQFLARQEADELRPEMPLGHAYLLARGPLPETGFVYVLVSKEQGDRLRGVKPLEELSVMVTVRAARTRYLATPVVEMVQIGGADSRTP